MSAASEDICCLYGLEKKCTNSKGYNAETCLHVGARIDWDGWICRSGSSCQGMVCSCARAGLSVGSGVVDATKGGGCVGERRSRSANP